MTLPIEIEKPDITPLKNCHDGIDWVTTFDSGRAGPHVVINALIHGNEISGPWSLLRLLESGLRPQAGKLSLALANIEAFNAFDPADPGATRYLDEDMNRLWIPEKLEGSGETIELRRARELLPLYRSADRLLDLHSMSTPSPALMISTIRAKGRVLAKAFGRPQFVVADRGHANGTRLIDFGRFADPADPAVAILLEAGQHWARVALDISYACCLEMLRVTGIVDERDIEAHMPDLEKPEQKLVEVTHPVTIKNGTFRFERDFTGLDIIETAGTVIAMDGDEPVVTPYDNCVLVMPSKRLGPGLTAVRLGRLVSPDAFVECP